MLDEYLKAQKAAQREYKARIARGELPFVEALDDIVPDSNVMKHQELGTIEIPTWLISGTMTRARQNSFAANFMPLLEADSEFAAKWENLYQAQLDEGFHSAIKVYEYLHRFYVQEGNKRVSVSRFLDMPTIMASVTRVIPDDETLKAHPIYAEFLDFYKVCPIYDLECREPGTYREIAKLLGRSIGQDEDPWPEDLVRSLQSAYWHFTRVLEAMQGKLSEMPRGDAFLVYLRIYTNDALSSKSNKEIDQRLNRIKNELFTAQNKDSVSLVESSEEAIKAGDGDGSGIPKPSALVGKVISSLTYTKKKPLKCAFVYDRKPEVSNWIMNHENGRKQLEKAFDGIVATKVFTGAGPATGSAALDEGSGNTLEAIDAAAEWGADVVFTVSPTQLDDALRAAIKYKDIIFLNCSVNIARQAVRTYYSKLYEAKFLAGIVAAVYSDNHKIGYCSDYPIYGTIAAINAFARGAAMIDPEAEIYLDWKSRQDGNWWHTMEEQGIRVISAVSSTHPVDGSSTYGVFRIEEDGSIRHLAAPVWKWGQFYTVIVRTIIDGTYNAKRVSRKDQATNYWWGMQSGVVDLALGESISPYTRALVSMLKEGIVNSAITPFDGELTSQDGCVKKESDPPLTSMDIINMDWLNENIIGEIPSKEKLNEEAKATVSVSGVKEK
ncbi:MAG: BMP family ABC transporter substrate-binding protein [Eubacterium sp.]|nr:BMP family ABC transporter substrate-binding protein [Eubacterium sp.]